MESDCGAIEEEILESQVFLDTAGHPASEMESDATTTEQHRVFTRRSDIQGQSYVLAIVMKLSHMLLALGGQLQQGRATLAAAAQFVGGRSSLEDLISGLEVGGAGACAHHSWLHCATTSVYCT